MIRSNLKILMTNKKITIRKMAEDTGIAQMTIIRARGKQINQSRICTLEVLAEYLGCKTKDLYEED